MLQQTSISSRALDFIFTTLWLSVLNYFVVFVNYTDVTKRLDKSILVAAAAGLALALIRPYINSWLKPLIKRNKNTDAGFFIQLVIFTLFFGGFMFVSGLHYRDDAGWSITRILLISAAVGVLMAMTFMFLLWVIKKIRGNKSNIPNSN